MVNKYYIKELLKNEKLFLNKKILIEGWVRSIRYSIFVSLNDGSTVKNLQIILQKNLDKSILKKITIGTSIKVVGFIEKSLGREQSIELKSIYLYIHKSVDTTYIQKSILQPKKHTLEKLRKQAHLRFQTNIFSCIMRIRHYTSFCIHKYFNKKNFFYIHTPIITTSNCEGNSKMFHITTIDNNSTLSYKDYYKDFFKKKTYLSVSGQLEAESAAIGLGKVYTFGPVFRAENSNTSKHLAEFWMVEPEIAFYDLNDNINLAEDCIKNIIKYVLYNCLDDLYFLEKNLKKWNNKKQDFLINRLKFVLKKPFQRINYTEAIKIINKEYKKIKYNPIVWGMDFQSEHEQFLVNKYFNIPIVIYNYPSCIKPFYMKINEDGLTVKAMDIIFPYIGEIIGGSQREERYEFLINRIKKTKISKKNLWWYIETRLFGSVPHSGFGLGLDRLIQFITGMKNIRDVIPFPRTPNNAEF